MGVSPSPPLESVRATPLGLGDGRHWFAPATVEAGTLDRRTVEKLGLIWVALHQALQRADPRDPSNPIDLPLLTIQFRHRYLTDVGLFYLESKRVPARTETPVNFRYPEVLLPAIPPDINRERLFNNLVDVLYCYWAVQLGFRYFIDGKYPELAATSAAKQRQIIGAIARHAGVTVDEVINESHGFLDTQLMRGKWFADATIVRLRAMWDKMLVWLGRDFYGLEMRQNDWGDRTRGRVGKLANFVPQAKVAGAERELLEAFISMCCELEGLKQYRDSDLHGTSPRITEALGRDDRDLDMNGLWQLMLWEIHRCTEGLMICFATVLAHAGDAPEGVATTGPQW